MALFTPEVTWHKYSNGIGSEDFVSPPDEWRRLHFPVRFAVTNLSEKSLVLSQLSKWKKNNLHSSEMIETPCNHCTEKEKHIVQ